MKNYLNRTKYQFRYLLVACDIKSLDYFWLYDRTPELEEEKRRFLYAKKTLSEEDFLKWIRDNTIEE